MAAVDWERSEPGAGFVVDEAKRLMRRARPHLAWMIVVGVVCAGAYAARKITAKRTYEGQMVLRIVEADKELTKDVRPPSAYFNYIWGVFLSGPNLKRIIEQEKVYKSQWAKDPQVAVESMRNDLEVQVWRNYFIFSQDSDDDEARSARVSISWPNPDPDAALSVVRALGKLIMDSQLEARREVFQSAVEEAGEAVESEAEKLAALRSSIALLELQAGRAPKDRQMIYAVQLREMRLQAVRLSKRTDSVSSARTQLELAAALERQRSGIRFEMIEPGVVIPGYVQGPAGLGVACLMIFLVTATLAGILFGAFSTRVRQPADIRRLGVRVLGAMPAYPGDSVGSLAQRLRAEDRLRLEKR